MSPIIATLLVLAGCCSNVIFLELLVKEDPGCGNLITFASFLFISIEGIIFTTKFGTVGPKVPMSAWTTLVVLYFLVSVVNNYALNFNISMPLHMIFRAGSLMANMILGMILLGKRYTPTKYLSVFMISIGIATCTIMSSHQSKANSATNQDDEKADDQRFSNDEEDEAWEYMRWMIGISMLTFALFLSARMGIYQEVIYGKHGKHPKEALFYSHFLPLPGFLFIAPNIYEHFMIALNSAPLIISGFDTGIPTMMAWLAGNILTQYICISAVFVLTSECASLTVTLVVTLRKFISLLFSIWYFENPFTWAHWLGTALVFSGTLVFSDVPAMIRQRKSKKE